jgi:parvulin-like peptidyl-prolyl isomerase
LGWFTPGQASSAFDEFIFNPETEPGIVSEPLFDDTIVAEGGYWLIKVLERKERTERVKVQGMLLGSDEEAQEVRDRLETGEDFDALAQELSQDASGEEGGDLGWMSPGEAVPPFDEFISDPQVEPGVVSEPIRDDTVVTRGGYWLIKVADKEDNRQVEENDRDLLKAEAFNEWVEALWESPEYVVESYLDEEQKVWAIEQAMKG